MVKETVSRSVVAKRMGSNPIPRKEFLCSLKTGWWQVRIFRTSAPALLHRVAGGAALQIALAQLVEHGPFKPVAAGSSPACGIIAIWR